MDLSCGEEAERFSTELPLLIFRSEFSTANAVRLSDEWGVGAAATDVRGDPDGGFAIRVAPKGRLWRFELESLIASGCFFLISGDTN